ncbi:MAG: glutathione peroxidase [Proteobacteria bacterium]|jgi:glutathione peroxidase|nr:glutathione peroxidase [Pseudomonadota bacterium]
MRVSKGLRNSLAFVLPLIAANTAYSACPAALDHHIRPLTEETSVHLCDVMSGKVVLVVNTASKCAYTPQYDGLEKLYERYRERGLIVAGFPSDDFAGQEPGTEKQIQEFCRLTYAVQFPMFEKVRVRGSSADPFYKHLVRVTGDQPSWNFHKYLLDRDGRVVASFPSRVTPDDKRLVNLIEELL